VCWGWGGGGREGVRVMRPGSPLQGQGFRQGLVQATLLPLVHTAHSAGALVPSASVGLQITTNKHMSQRPLAPCNQPR
jgi:hypothetical protein